MAAELFQHREEPLETGVTFDRYMHPPRAARPQARKLVLQGFDLRQDLLRKLQQPLPGGRQLQRFRAPHKEFDPRLILQPLHLMT